MVFHINSSWHTWRVFYTLTCIARQLLPNAEIELIWRDDESMSVDIVVPGLDWQMCTAVYNINGDTDLRMRMKDGSTIVYDHLIPGQLQADMPERLAASVKEWLEKNQPRPPVMMGTASYHLPNGYDAAAHQVNLLRIAQRNFWRLSIAYQGNSGGLKPIVSSWQLDTERRPYLILFRINNEEWILMDVPNAKLHANTPSSREADKLLREITNL